MTIKEGSDVFEVCVYCGVENCDGDRILLLSEECQQRIVDHILRKNTARDQHRYKSSEDMK